jgi:alkylation response protein AidB-like acyl-CoA dehydrogenase
VELTFTPEQERFRESARQWLVASIPDEPRPADGAEAADYDRRWQRRQFEGGWAGLSWPVEHGGRGLSLAEQTIWWEEYARAGAPRLGVSLIGLSHAGPTLIACGTNEQQSRYLPEILRGDAVWCQGFSEPQAGSDLANIQTGAVVDRDRLIVNGQKIWTGNAQFADYQELLIRTSTGERKHDGLSWVVCDMRLPGVEVRPIKTMDGASHFCEVFYTDVEIPLDCIVGKVGEGWNVAMANIAYERATALTSAQLDLAETVAELILLAQRLPGQAGGSLLADDAGLRRSLATVSAEVAGLRALTYGTLSRLQQAPTPGPEGSMVRLYYTELAQSVSRIAMDILGSQAVYLDELDSRGRSWTRDYLVSFKETISGGTKDIQRNTIATRVLGLPRSS